MKRYVFSPGARSDLIELWEFIAQDNLEAADRVVAGIEEACVKLSETPLMGHLRPDLAGCRRWIDQETTSCAHAYALRGRISVSKSSRATCGLEVVPPSTEIFRRGDVDSNRVLEITDAIVLLSFLFLGGPEPACLDASDADDNGALEITDAINVLAYLFTGGDPTPAPGPVSCGPDPTADRLPACGTACR